MALERMMTDSAGRIFESPDKGETVYARVPGEYKRILVKESEQVKSMREKIHEDKLWNEIRTMAKTDPAMKDLADKLIMTYHLLKDKE